MVGDRLTAGRCPSQLRAAPRSSVPTTSRASTSGAAPPTPWDPRSASTTSCKVATPPLAHTLAHSLSASIPLWFRLLAPQSHSVAQQGALWGRPAGRLRTEQKPPLPRKAQNIQRRCRRTGSSGRRNRMRRGRVLILRFEESFTASLSVTSAHCGTYWGLMYGGPEVRVTKRETSVLLGRREWVEPVCPWNQ